MKFRTDECAKHFVMELGRSDLLPTVNKSWNPSDDMVEDIIKKRRPVFTTLKNFARSSAQKSNWRANRYNILRGIREFHRSTRGKRFHKDMGRFLVRKIFSPLTAYRNQKARELGLSITEKSDVMKSISSMKTHLIIECSFYHRTYEQYGLEWLMNEGIPIFNTIESDILANRPITEEYFDMLIDMTEKTELIHALAKEFNVKSNEVERIWNTIKKSLIDQGRDEDDDNFYALLVSSVKKALKK